MAFFGNNVYILGAGFSTSAGLPVMKNFLTKMRDALELNDNLSDAGKSAIKEVFKLKALLSSTREKLVLDLDNIEELFSVIEAVPSLNDFNKQNSTSAIRKAISATLISNYKDPNYVRMNAVVDVKKFASIVPNRLNDPHYLECSPYDLFAAMICQKCDPNIGNGEKDTVITFNYDTVLEKSIKNVGCQYDYGLEHNLNSDDQRVRIIKLHGSINWCQKDQINIEVKEPEEILNNDKIVPFIVPPTWNKTTNNSIILKLWNDAINIIANAHRIYIIGYSMPVTDSYFKYLLAAGLSQNHHLRSFWTINPSTLNHLDSFLDKTYFEGRRRNENKHFENIFDYLPNLHHTFNRGQIFKVN